MTEPKILHASLDGVHVLRLAGELRYPISPSIECFLDRLFAETDPVGFVVDLTETEYIDSTNLGLLARIAKEMKARGGKRVTLVSTRTDINEVLLAMGFDEVFDLVRRPWNTPARGQALPLEEADRGALAHTVLEAHRILMALNERNRDQFQDVVAALERKARAQSGSGGS